MYGRGGRHGVWRLVAVVAGAIVGLTTPLLVLVGDTVDPVVGNAGIIAYTIAAVVWTRHTLTVSAPWWGRLSAAALAVGLLIASSGFFLAIGALIATLGAASHAAALLSRPELGQRQLGSILALTAVGVVVAAMIGDVTTEGGFAATMVVFASGVASATASLGIRPTARTTPPDRHVKTADGTAAVNGSSN